MRYPAADTLAGASRTIFGLDAWAYNFGNLVNTGYATYGLTSAQTSNIQNLAALYRAAMVANVKPLKSSALTTAFNLAKQNLLNAVRPLTQIVSAQPESIVNRNSKAQLRVNPHWNDKGIAGANAVPRTPILPPDSAPEISVEPVGNLQMLFRFHWAKSELRTANSKVRSNAKPLGATALEMAYKLTPPTGADPYSGMTPMVTASRSPFSHIFPAQLAGRTIFMAGRWVSERGAHSGWSGFLSCTCPIEGVSSVTAPLG